MKVNITFKILLLLFITSCVGTSSQGIFGTGVSVALDPRSIGTQIDDKFFCIRPVHGKMHEMA